MFLSPLQFRQIADNLRQFPVASALRQIEAHRSMGFSDFDCDRLTVFVNSTFRSQLNSLEA